MKYKVSIITPCYNAENTLEREINSIINQTLGFENIELLLYDDKSSDNTGQIIKKFSEEYSNIKAFFGNENRGPGFARNKCLENSNGEYILFLDSDDEFDLDMCNKLYSTAMSENADLVCCGVLRKDKIDVSKKSLEYDASKATENTEDKIIFINKNGFYLNDNLTTHCLFEYGTIIKNNVNFSETYYAEDVYFKLMYKLHSKKTVYLKNYFGYIHHAYTESTTSKIDLDILNKIHDAQLDNMKQLKGYDLDLAFIFKGHIICSLIRLYALDLIKSPKSDVIDFLKKIREFEIETDSEYSFDFPINFLNGLILKERYNLAYVCLYILRTLYHSKTLRKISRMFFK